MREKKIREDNSQPLVLPPWALESSGQIDSQVEAEAEAEAEANIESKGLTLTTDSELEPMFGYHIYSDVRDGTKLVQNRRWKIV
eukprot:339270-Hanusia_phi.AAC.3